MRTRGASGVQRDRPVAAPCDCAASARPGRSCTIDASVKIYAYRVDSILAETYKVLGGLSRSGNENEPGAADAAASGEPETDADGKRGDGLVGDGDNDSEIGADDAPGSRHPRKAKKAPVAAATLEADVESLNLKQLEIDVAADPLFQKATTAPGSRPTVPTTGPLTRAPRMPRCRPPSTRAACAACY